MELLAYLGIHSHKDFLKWAVKNHPDKLGDDSDATRRFQIVSNAFKTSLDVPVPATTMSMHDFMSEMRVKYHQFKCKAVVEGAPANLCNRSKESGSEFCFYHSSEDHLKYVDGDDIVEFFSQSSDTISFQRSAATCVAIEEYSGGRYCRHPAHPGHKTCRKHTKSVSVGTNTSCLATHLPTFPTT